MANPRRNSYSTNQSVDGSFQSQTQSSSSLSSLKHLLKKPHALPFLLLLLLLLTWVSLRLQYSSRFRHPQLGQDDHGDDDSKANLVRFKSGLPSAIVKDKRGWLLDPVSLSLQFGVERCLVLKYTLVKFDVVVLGEITDTIPVMKHLSFGERRQNSGYSLFSWNTILILLHMSERKKPKTLIKEPTADCFGSNDFGFIQLVYLTCPLPVNLLENNQMDGRGYAEVTIGEDEVVVAASPSGTAHALVNVDAFRKTYFVGCQDGMMKSNSSNTDFNLA
ncbi:hypothetical protein CXB51_035058 [Gossypium anomalum]|uniref:Uncharacterized protein n=1 Tax=Gossypium anomalum TaxID=47600 RepID=A0A8J5Y202_9ROSI|nr:hypothetical protein CXB51_035058 [Gossypium anomalum]